jgi:hypothetical protein
MSGSAFERRQAQARAVAARALDDAKTERVMRQRIQGLNMDRRAALAEVVALCNGQRYDEAQRIMAALMGEDK